jgi:hypothetical protein
MAQETSLFRRGETNGCSFATYQCECAKNCLKIKTECICLLLLNSTLHRLPMKGSTSASAAPQTSVMPSSLKPVKFEIHVPEGRLYVTQKEERIWGKWRKSFSGKTKTDGYAWLLHDTHIVEMMKENEEVGLVMMYVFGCSQHYEHGDSLRPLKFVSRMCTILHFC